MSEKYTPNQRSMMELRKYSRRENPIPSDDSTSRTEAPMVMNTLYREVSEDKTA